jgi:cytochrome c peroxidase
MTRTHVLSALLLSAVLVEARSAQAVLTFPVPPVPAGNPLTPEKALLGMALFHEEQLSSDDTMACATCHLPEAGGADPRPAARHPGVDGLLDTPDDEHGSPGMHLLTAAGDHASHPLFGTQRQVTTRNAPSVVGAAFFDRLFWDGRARSTFRDLSGRVVLDSAAALETQAVAPLTSDVEMAGQGRTWATITEKLGRVRPLALASDLPERLERFVRGGSGYPRLFARAFGTPEITRERIAMALASYERTLVADRTPFDLGTMSADQQAGFALFSERGSCSNCHRTDNALFSDGLQHFISLPDHGRIVKTPSLRNVGLRPRLMSGGVFGDLEEVLDHYQGIGFLDPLTPIERAQLLAFLREALTDPRLVARSAPFDRPVLRSERVPPGSNLSREGTPGSGGLEPVLLADAPPVAGSPFRLGIANARGGALALLVLGSDPAPPGTTIAGVPLHVDPGSARVQLVPLAGDGPGNGLGTWRVLLPPSATLVGPERWVQALVPDPEAAGGLATTALAHLVLESALVDRSGPLAPRGAP